METPNVSFPDEIIWRILSFSSPLEVVHRARLVSKHFRDITYDTELWRVLYANARLLRPPGPFPSQSARFLERTLMQSVRFEQSFVIGPFQEISCKEIPIRPDPLHRAPRFVPSKWFFTCESSMNIMLYDIDSDTHPARILWQNEASITRWDACSIGGELIYVLIDDARELKLLEFKIDEEHGPVFCDSLEVPKAKTESILLTLFAANSPFVYIAGLNLFFDTRTRTFYVLPEFRTELVPQRIPQTYSVLITPTHILIGVRIRISGVGKSLMQAFTLPTDTRPSALYLTHECVTDTFDFRSLIRDPIVDPITGSTRLRFLRRSFQKKDICFSCDDFTLAQSRGGAVLPISIDTHDLFSINPPFSWICDENLFVEASHDGHVRGLCMTMRDLDKRYCVKFAIDATKDRCVSSVGEVVQSEAKGGYSTYYYFVSWFDGVRGRVCYIAHNGEDPRDTTPFIVDIK